MSDLVKRLRTIAGMITMGERIAWGSDTAIMHEAADRIDALEAENKALREALRDCVNFMENTESELGITLSSADRARALLEKEKAS